MVCVQFCTEHKAPVTPAWFLQRNERKQLFAFPSSMREFVMPHTMHLTSVPFALKKCLYKAGTQKYEHLSPKMSTSKCSRHLSKYYLVCGLNVV